MTPSVPRAVGAWRSDIPGDEDKTLLQMGAVAANRGYELLAGIVLIDPDRENPTAWLITVVRASGADVVIVPSLPHLCELGPINRVAGVIQLNPKERRGPERPSETSHLTLVK